MKKIIVLATIFAIFATMLAIPMQVGADSSVVYVYNLEPSWTAFGGGGVNSGYAGPPDYSPVSPGTTTVYDGREAGIIKAGLSVWPGNIDNWDDGYFAFIPNVTIDVLAAGTLTYDVENQYGVNPVWITIEIDTGVVGDRADNTAYQYIPAPYTPGVYNTVNANDGSAQWQRWVGGNGVGNMMTLGQVAAAHTGSNVVRAYLRLGMGDSYHTYTGSIDGNGTVAWVDKATIGGVTYDFVVNHGTTTVGGTVTGPSISVTAPSAIDFGPFASATNSKWADTAGSVSVTLGSSETASWQVTATDQYTGTGTGHMYNGAFLTNPLGISSDAVNWKVAGGSAWNGYGSGPLTYSGSGASGSLPFAAQQTIVAGDAAGTYSITIVFSATITGY
jgi:hypothetical protein